MRKTLDNSRHQTFSDQVKNLSGQPNLVRQYIINRLNLQKKHEMYSFRSYHTHCVLTNDAILPQITVNLI